MSMLTYLTAGESHGKALTAIIEGLPANLNIDIKFINDELQRRQLGYGRSQRMRIEKDEIQVLSGVRDGITIGSPVSFTIENKDWTNWQSKMDVESVKDSDALSTPRPGHADLAGSLKTGLKDLRNILERSSARQTAALVGVGSFAKLFLKQFSVDILSRVTSIGKVKAKNSPIEVSMLEEIDKSAVRVTDKIAEKDMVAAIEEAQSKGDTLGGTFEVVAKDLVAGLGGYSTPGKRLDGRLCQALTSIPAVKGAVVGQIEEAAHLPGSEAHDEIHFNKEKGYYRKTNKAGGIEGGISNGSDIVLKGFMKPIPTLSKPLATVDMKNKKAAQAFKERHDTVAVPAAAVIAESAVAIVLASAMLEKFGADNLNDLKQNYKNYLKRIKLM